MVRIFLKLFGQIGEVLLSPCLARKIGAFVNVVKDVLIRLGTRGGIFGERLKYIQISLRSFGLMKVLLHHSEFVVAGSRVAAYFDVPPEKYCGLFESLAGDAHIRQLQ